MVLLFIQSFGDRMQTYQASGLPKNSGCRVKRNCFTNCRFALGTQAPQVSGVKVFRSAAAGGTDTDDVTFEIELLWGGNPVSLKVTCENGEYLATPHMAACMLKREAERFQHTISGPTACQTPADV